MLALDQLTANGLGQIGTEKRPHLVAEGELFRGEAEIHHSDSLLRHPRDSGNDGVEAKADKYHEVKPRPSAARRRISAAGCKVPSSDRSA